LPASSPPPLEVLPLVPPLVLLPLVPPLVLPLVPPLVLLPLAPPLVLLFEPGLGFDSSEEQLAATSPASATTDVTVNVISLWWLIKDLPTKLGHRTSLNL
jgi:hypothetical protein